MFVDSLGVDNKFGLLLIVPQSTQKTSSKQARLNTQLNIDDNILTTTDGAGITAYDQAEFQPLGIILAVLKKVQE